MIRNNQITSSYDTTSCGACGCNPIPEPIVPPVVPIVSVRSVDGMTGDVELKKLTIGTKEYDGSQDVTIYPVDFGFEGTVNYRGWTTSDKILVTPVEIGDLYYASDKLEFWLAIARGDGAGVFKTIPTVDFLAPYAFIKETASQIELRFTDVDQSYTFFAVLKDKLGNEIYTSNELDLPIEQLVKEIKYDHTTRSLIFVLQSGKEISVSLMELVDTLQEKITPEKKLAFDLVDGLTDFKIATDSSITTLQSDLSAEILRSKAEEAKLDAAIKAEETARIAAVAEEAQLRAAADTTEATTRSDKDDELAGKIAVNKTNIEAEKNRAEAAENTITTNLNTEISDRKVVDADHKAILDSHTSKLKTLEETTIPEINNAITTERNARASADTELNTAINAEATTRQQEDTSIRTAFAQADAKLKLDYETADAQIITDYKSADDILDKKITAEKERAEGQEANIRNEFAAADNIVRAEFAAADDAIKVRVKAIEDADFGTQINTEKDARIAADDTLNTRIDTVVTNYEAADAQIIKDYKAADTILQANIDKVVADLATETARAISAEGTLTTALNTEADRAEEAEEELTRNLAKEVQDRLAGDTAVETKLNTEISNRIAAVASEEEARKAQDEILANYIKAEKDAREASDTTLDTKISTETTRATAAELAEETRAKAAEEAEKVRAEEAEATEKARAEGAEATEKARAEGVEATLTTSKVTVLPTIDDPADPEYGQAYHMFYNAEVIPDADKIDITVKTLTLDNNLTKQNLVKSIPGATQATAGLLSAADKYKIDNAVTTTGLAEEVARAKAREDQIESDYKLADTNLSSRVTSIETKVPTWDAMYTKPSAGIPKTDLTTEIQASLAKADISATDENLQSEITRATAKENEIESAYKLADQGLSDRIDAIHVAEYTMIKDATSGEYAAVYHLTKDGVNQGVEINIPKDQMLKDVKTGTCTTENVPEGFHVGEHYIELIFDTASGEVKRYIKVEDVIKPYTGSDTINISTDNVISVNEANLTRVTQEIADRKAEDLAITGALSNEISRATTKEGELEKAIKAEETRAKAAEQVLTDNLAQEVQDRKDAVAAEETRAKSAEATLTTNLNNEITRAQEAEAAETARAQGAEATLTTNLNQEIQDRIADVDAEELRAKTAEAAEESRALAAEKAEKDRAEAAEKAEKERAELAEATELARAKAAEEAEEARAIAAEATKTDKELTNANGKAQIMNESDGGGIFFIKDDNTSKSFVGVNDSTLGGPDAQIYAINPSDSNNGAKLDILKTGMYYTVGSTPYASRIIAENEIAVRKNVTEEETRAKAAESTLTTNLSNEVNRAQQAESDLSDAISQEVTDRKAAIEALDTTQTITSQKIISKVTEVNGIVSVETRDLAISEVINLQSSLDTLTAAIKKEAEVDRPAALAQEVADRNTAITNAVDALDATVTTTASDGYAITSIEEENGKLTKINSTKITIAMVDGLQAALDALSARIKALEDLKITVEDKEIGE